MTFSSVFPRFNRVQATLLISTFATLIVTCTAPWMVVMIIGFITRRGCYDAAARQVFNRRQTGGRYWFNHGWNLRGMAAWLISAVVGLCMVNILGQFQGRLGNLAGGVDIGLPASLVLAAVLYLGLLWIFPKPRGVFPAAGPRWVPSSNTPVQPVFDAGGNVVPTDPSEASIVQQQGEPDADLVSQA